MNILFVITNINGTYGDAYSFGLASIASITRDKGFDYDIKVVNKIEDYDALFGVVERKKPKIIGYSTVSSQFMFVKDIASKIRANFHDTIIQVCGGIHPTIYPECILEAEMLDGIFIGEAEYAFSDFLDRLANGMSYRDVKNFAFNNHGTLVKNRLYPIETELEKLPFPERDKYGYDRFIKRDGTAHFLFARGCPYNCSYCCNKAKAQTYNMSMNTPRYRTPESSIEEIKRLLNKVPFRKVCIVDDIFGVDKKWMREFCNKYAKEIGLPLTCLLRVDIVNEEIMEYLKIAGCVHVSCGVESGNDYIRKEIMKRRISEKQILNAYALFKKYKITSNAINIIGVPQESVGTIWETIKLNRKINPTSSGVNIFYPYRGTELGNYCFKNGLVDEDIFSKFNAERRESCLTFTPEFRKQLVYFHRNWQLLVYKHRPLEYFHYYLFKHMPTPLWNTLRFIKGRVHMVLSIGRGFFVTILKMFDNGR